MIPLYGGTEFGVPVSFRKGLRDKSDCEYISFTQLKARWDDQGDGTYELQVLVRSHSFCRIKLLTPYKTDKRYASTCLGKPVGCEGIFDL